MKKFLAVLMLCSLSASAAYAIDTRIWYLRASASDASSNDGTSYQEAVGSMARITTLVAAAHDTTHHLVLVYPTGVSGNELEGGGSFSTIPNPVGITQPYRVRYVSAVWLATGDDSVLSINASTNDLTKSRVTIAGFRLTNGIDMGGGATRDSIISCSTPETPFPQGKDIQINGADSCTIYNCVIRCNTFWAASDNNYDVANTWDSNFWPRLGVGKCNDTVMRVGQNAGDFVDARMYRNRFSITLDACQDQGGSMPRMQQFSRGGLYKYNRWDVHSMHPPGPWSYGRTAVYFRDSCWSNQMVGDTIICHGPYYSMIELSGSGNYPGTVWGNSMDSCYVFVKNGDGLVYQDGADGTSITNSVIVASEHAVDIPSIGEEGTVSTNKKAVFRHNLFISDGNSGNEKGVVRFSAAPISYPDTVTFMENIVYAYNAPISCPDMVQPGSGYAMWIDGKTIDSLAYYGGSDSVTRTVPRIAGRKHKFNNNLYFYRSDSLPCIGCSGGAPECGGGRSIGTNKVGGSVVSKPGSGYHGNWHSRYGLDSLSYYGSPQLGYGGSDSLFLAFEDPRGVAANIGALSAARGRGVGGIDIGPRQFGTGHGTLQVSSGDPQPWCSSGVPLAVSTFTVTISNVGTDTLTVSDVVASRTGGSGSYSVSPTTAAIAPGGSADFVVTYVSGGGQQGVNTTIGTVDFYSNDPATPVYRLNLYCSLGDAAVTEADDE